MFTKFDLYFRLLLQSSSDVEYLKQYVESVLNKIPIDRIIKEDRDIGWEVEYFGAGLYTLKLRE